MIQRFYFAKLLDHEAAARAELGARLAAQLRAAGAEVIAGIPADESAARWDVSIVISAPSLAAWRALAALPAVTSAIDELAARAAVVKAWTFQAA